MLRRNVLALLLFVAAVFPLRQLLRGAGIEVRRAVLKQGEHPCNPGGKVVLSLTFGQSHDPEAEFGIANGTYEKGFSSSVVESLHNIRRRLRVQRLGNDIGIKHDHWQRDMPRGKST